MSRPAPGHLMTVVRVLGGGGAILGVLHAAQLADGGNTGVAGAGLSLAMALTGGWMATELAHRSSADDEPTTAGAETTDDGTRTWVWSASVDGTMVSSTAVVETMLGYRIEDLVGRDVFEIVHVDDRDEARNRLQEAVAGRRGWTDWVLRIMHADGTERWLESTASSIADSTGRVVGFRGESRDVTASMLSDRAARASRDAGAAKRRRIQQVLDDPTACLHMVFQPIVATDGTVVGTEALARFTTTPNRTPDRWFAEAAEVGLGSELEMLAIQSAIAQIDALPGFLAVNVSPATLLSPALHQLAADPSFPGTRIVIELTEGEAVETYGILREALARLRREGVRFAVDDAGAGYSNLQRILELRPDFIKLDRSMVAGIERDPARRALATALADFARSIGADTIGEGVEQPAELHALRVAGIGWAQGFLFGMPSPPPVLVDAEVSTSGLRSLVIDDDPVVRLLVSRTARRAGLEVVGQAADGREGIELANRLRPDVIVLDLAMPVVHGADALPELRRNHPQAFIIVLSATADPRRAAEVIDLGASAFIGKDEAGVRLGEAFATALAARASAPSPHQQR